MVSRVAAAVVLLLALAGCGEEQSSGEPAGTAGSPTESESLSEPARPSPSGPDCEEVWAAGARLPAGFKGCVQDGAFVRAEPRPCSSGQRLFTHADRFYAVAGGKISETAGPLLEDEDYQQVLAVCTG